MLTSFSFLGELSQVSEALKESDKTDTNNIGVMPLIRK